jgi:hypothetical protein
MVVEGLMFGHRAYNAMNSEIETMTMAEEAVSFKRFKFLEGEFQFFTNLQQLFAKSSKAEVDVCDHEMAQHFASTAKAKVTKKFTPKGHLTSRPVQGDMPPILQQGVQLLQQTKSMSKAWTKKDSRKNRKFLKPSKGDI